MWDKTLSITNGEYFNEYLISKFGGVAVPFCESVMDGEVVKNIYSDEFVALRAKALNVIEKEYRAKMYAYNVLQSNEYRTICLWFGKDTFCQVNLLTLLAYLEQINYQGELKLNYIDDETFEILEANIDIKLGKYGKIYEEILIHKCIPQDIGVLCAKGIELYFDYRDENGALSKLARMNASKGRAELMKLLLERSKDYGLSNIQAERIIKSNLSGCFKKL